MHLLKDEIENKEKRKKDKVLDSKIFYFLKRKKLTNIPAYSIWEIFEKIFNIKIEKIKNNYKHSMNLLEVGCAVYRLKKCGKIVEIYVKKDKITYYMAR